MPLITQLSLNPKRCRRASAVEASTPLVAVMCDLSRILVLSKIVLWADVRGDRTPYGDDVIVSRASTRLFRTRVL